MYAKIASQAPKPASTNPAPVSVAAAAASPQKPVAASGSVSKALPTNTAALPDPSLPRAVVVDSGPFIKNARLDSLDAEIFTVPEVLREIRDEDTRRRIELLPFEIKTREPTEQSIQFIKYFAAKTGDLRVLSDVDIRVMALTLMLEKERVGMTHLRKEPKPIDTEDSSQTEPQCSTQATNGVTEPLANTIQIKEHNQSPFDGAGGEPSTKPDEKLPGWESGSEEEGDNLVDAATKESAALAESSDSKPEDAAKKGSQSAPTRSGDDGHGEWITPENVQRFKIRDGPTQFGDASEAKVSCMTTDYAMQNVMLQIGLRVLSVDGLLIKTVRQYILQCDSCYKTTSQMDKMFCPSCGSHNFKRLSMVTKESGEVEYYGGQRRTNLRGTKYSIPAPKSGRHANNIILREDQPEMIRHRPKSKAQPDAFDPDFAFGSSRSAFNSMQYGYGKKNPNVVRKKTGNKK